MQKVIIDTNVIVSALIQRNYPYHIIYDLFLGDRISLHVSSQLIKEYYDVLTRPKFLRFQDFSAKAKNLLGIIEMKAIYHDPVIALDIISDKDDNKLLELADACMADFIITGNTTDFTFSQYKQTKIVTPKEYWELYKPSLY